MLKRVSINLLLSLFLLIFLVGCSSSTTEDNENYLYKENNPYNTHSVSVNRNTFEKEELFDGLRSLDSYFYSFLDVYDGLLIYTEYNQRDSQDAKLVMYDTDTGEKKYIE